MSNGHNNTSETPTRREYVKYGSAVIGGGLLAGCTSSGGSGGGANNSTNSGSRVNSLNSSNSSGDGNTTTDSGGNSYSVSMSPMGKVEFDRVPKNVMAESTNYIDISAALGHGAVVKSTPSPSIVVPSLQYFYPKLDVSTEWINFKELGQYGKETLYEQDSDVHFVDSCYLASKDGWDKGDVEEVQKNVGSVFGNMYSRKHRQPPESCRGSYQYYTIWELTEKYASVFKEQNRCKQLKEIHRSLLDRIQSNLPSSSDRPIVGMVYPRLSEDAFYVHKLNGPGYFRAHTRPLAATDAFSDISVNEYGGALIDYEAMLETDPDILIMNHGISNYYDVSETKQSIQNHPVGSKLAAVQNERLYVSGNPRQGPVMNLFQLEMTAKQIYPDQFGEWPGYKDRKPYPKIPKEDQLFDRQRVADIIKGEL